MAIQQPNNLKTVYINLSILDDQEDAHLEELENKKSQQLYKIF